MQEKLTALYERLSHDDDLMGEEWTRSKTPMRGVRRRWQGS